MRLFRAFRREDFPCDRFVEVVTDYLDGAMPPAERKQLERHLQICDGCARYLEQIRKTIEMSGRLTVADVEALDDHARESLMAAFRDFHAGTR
jgi:anti-sigma factor RsiW